jgi:multidrug efflux pump subunit AcrB
MRSRHGAPVDPAVASIGAAVGAGGGNTTVNNGRVFIALKPRSQRDSMDQVLARLRTNLAKIQGITLYMQAAQDITIGGRVSKTQYQYTLDDADPGELNRWAALFLDRIKKIPGITDVATDQLNAGPMLDITIKREVASSYGILPYTIDNTLDDAFGQRIVSTMYTALRDRYSKGLSAYRAQRWEDARNSLRAALDIAPKDGPSLALLKRIEGFQTSPPASNWDGVWHMDHK